MQRTTREHLERAILSTLLRTPDHIPEAQDRLTPEHFSSGGRRLVFESMLQMQAQDQAVDLTTLYGFISDRVKVTGVASALSDLAINQAVAGHLETYMTQLRVIHTLNGVSEACQRGVMAVSETDHSEEGVRELVSGISKEMDECAGSVAGRGNVNIAETLQAVFEGLEHGESPGVSSGFDQVDVKLNRLRPGKLIVIAGRPSMGKSALALTMARHIAHSHHVAFWSMEMTREEIVQRLLAQAASVDLGRIISMRVAEDVREKLLAEGKNLQRLQMTLSDNPSISPAAIRAEIRRSMRSNPIKVVIVDYLQIMESAKKVESRNIEIGSYSRALKNIAMEFKIPVIALAQLNRQVESRTDKDGKIGVPRLSDLRDSGSIEQDADQVLLLYRPWIYNSLKDDEHKAELIVAKNRNGETGNIDLFFRGHYTRFESNLAEEHMIHA